jgi:hypothetical protein
MMESLAEELEAAVREWELETLTLDQAAEESPFKRDTLRKKVGSGEIPNAGTKGSPRIRRGDLHGKGGYDPPGPMLEEARKRIFGEP